MHNDGSLKILHCVCCYCLTSFRYLLTFSKADTVNNRFRYFYLNKKYMYKFRCVHFPGLVWRDRFGIGKRNSVKIG